MMARAGAMRIRIASSWSTTILAGPHPSKPRPAAFGPRSPASSRSRWSTSVATAIPGLAAKPIIDIMLIPATDQARWPRLIEPIQTLGYVFWAENPRQDRMFFVKGMPPFGERRTHHIHVRTRSDAETALLFRDHLRRHPEDLARYASLKRDLATRHTTDRDAYTEGKSQFVDGVIRKARSPWAI